MIAFLNWLDGVLWGVPLIALMILTGLYFTVRSGFFQFRHFGWIMKRTGGNCSRKINAPNTKLWSCALPDKPCSPLQRSSSA